MFNVLLETQHGVRELTGHPTATIADVLRQAGVPLTAVWTYRQGTSGVEFLSAATRLADLDSDAHARANRNVDLLGLSRATPPSERAISNPTTEWTLPGVGGGVWDLTAALLSRDDCVSIVRRAVDRVLDQWPHDVNRGLVVGTSGGGDSNVLLTALVESSKISRDQIVPAIVVGPDMSVHVDWARTLCRDLGVKLNIIDGDRLKEMAGIRSIDRFFGAFEQHYPDADIDFPWTWLLRRALAGFARASRIRGVAIGANREDLLSEGFLRLSRGLAPMPAPYRRIGAEVFVYPMCEVPKKIGDGAYPGRSLDNYEQRNPSISAGRSVFYQAAYLIADSLPGLDTTLLNGFNRLGTRATEAEDPIEWDSVLADHVVQNMTTDEQRKRWLAFLAEVTDR